MQNYVTQNGGSNGFNIGVLKNLGTDKNPQYVPFDLYEDPRTGELWVAAEEGQRYYLEFLVPSFGRYKAVTSIDGMNIMDGSKCAGGANEKAWVINEASSYGANVIAGWYRNGNSLASFVFSKVEESYSVLIGKGADNLGVIGARFYFERPKQVFRGGGYATRGGLGLESTRGSSKGLGTGYGEEVEFKSESTTFDVDYGRTPVTVVLRYLPAAELVKAGMRPLSARPTAAKANPFPGEVTGCQPPPGWKGGRNGN